MNTRHDQDRIVKVIDLNAPIARVWHAITDHTEFGAWFRVRLDNPFELGQTTTGMITAPGYEHIEWESVTERIEHEHVFAFSWPPSAVDPETQYPADAKVLVEFRLESTPAGGTRLTITESGFHVFPDTKRLDILRSNTEGWDIQAEHIAAHVNENRASFP